MNERIAHGSMREHGSHCRFMVNHQMYTTASIDCLSLHHGQHWDILSGISGFLIGLLLTGAQTDM